MFFEVEPKLQTPYKPRLDSSGPALWKYFSHDDCKSKTILFCISLGDRPAVPRSPESDPREGRLHHVWLPQTSAHVPHGVPRHDQQGPLPRCAAYT